MSESKSATTKVPSKKKANKVNAEVDIAALVKQSRQFDFNDNDVEDESKPMPPVPKQNLYVSADQRPGGGSTQIELELHTRNAFGFILGRDKTVTQSFIPGLFVYANAVRSIVTAAMQDDPWADWALIRIEEAMLKVDAIINAERDLIKQRVSDLKNEGILLSPLTNKKPTKIVIDFHSPYALRGALLVAKFDTVIRELLPFRTTGIIDDAEWRFAVRKVGIAIQNLFMIAMRFKYRGVSRESYIKMPESALVLNVLAVAGKIPNNIVTGDKIPKLMPRVQRFKIDAQTEHKENR